MDRNLAPTPGGDNPQAREEALWMAEAAAGNKASFARLYDRFAPLLLGIGIRMLQNRGEAEDTLHDVFIEVWKRAADFDPQRGPARAWVVLRMRSRCLDRKKSPRIARSSSLDDVAWSKQQAPVQDPLLRLQRERVQLALGTLSTEQRNLVDLAYFQGLSTSEISEKLGVPSGTVKSRLYAARAKLAAVLVGPDEAGALQAARAGDGGRP